ncbi:MAG: BatA domain-containing protein [Erythrobacter sp.]|uniref:BatA domain-containing protein n=1 Tax=Erythrobacter sp. TaxID=1042 RepID=UPI002B45A8E4|nr:BatA domain-containing protein [Erythrobacter sp.]WRH70641.1 MAG: BatA domain-containing protein [Erythrobacter sp.]
MTPLLLAPLGLVALAALIGPLLIHLRRRTEEIPLDFAALRWLDPRPRPRQRLQFDEWLLLALRLLLVALLALLLARPAVLGWEDDGARVLAAPGLDPAAARKAAGADADIRWIAPGFPPVENASPKRSQAIASLIRQFDAELPEGAGLMILVPAVFDGADAAPLRLTRKAEWRVIDAPAAETRAEPVANPAMAVRHAAAQAGQLRFLRAAAEAWGGALRFEAKSDDSLPPPDTVLVWLTPGPLPPAVTRWVEDGGTALLGHSAEVAMPAASAPLWQGEGGVVLVEGGPLGAGRIMRFAQPLEPAAMPDLLAPGFATALRDLVLPPAPPPARVKAQDYAPKAGTAPFALPPRELSSWLGVLIAAVFLAERLLAARRRRFAA